MLRSSVFGLEGNPLLNVKAPEVGKTVGAELVQPPYFFQHDHLGSTGNVYSPPLVFPSMAGPDPFRPDTVAVVPLSSPATTRTRSEGSGAAAAWK